jgi:hypothetical protein
MKSNRYNLYEIFKLNGNRFPFQVRFIWNHQPKGTVLTFIKRIQNQSDLEKFTWICNRPACGTCCAPLIGHQGFADDKLYELIDNEWANCPHDRWNYDVLMKKPCPCEVAFRERISKDITE